MGRSRLLTVLVVAVAAAVWLATWPLVAIDTFPEVRIDCKRPAPDAEATFRLWIAGEEYQPRGFRLHDGTDSVLVEWKTYPALDAEATRYAVDWRCRLSLDGVARDAVVEVQVNGQPLAKAPVRELRRLTIPRHLLVAGLNTLGVYGVGPESFVSAKLANYHGTSHRFPRVWLLGRRDGIFITPPDQRHVLDLLAVVVALVAASLALWGITYWLWGTPLVTRRQLRLIGQWPAIALAALAAVNVVSGLVVLLSHVTAIAALVVWWAVGVTVCAWLNVRRGPMATWADQRQERWLDVGRAGLVFLVVLAVYLSNGQRVGQLDGIPPPRIAMSLIREGNLDLDEFPWRERDIGQHVVQGAEHVLSRWSPASGILAVPVFLVPTLMGLEPDAPDVEVLAKLSASLVTALAVVFLFLVLRRITTRKLASWLAVTYALATSLWSTASQDLWQHGPAVLFLGIGLWAQCRTERRAAWHAVAAVFLSFVVFIRPSDVGLVVALYVFAAWRDGWRVWIVYAVASLPAAASYLGYNWHYFGVERVLSGGYAIPWGGVTGAGSMAGTWWTGDLGGVGGLLVSPNRGALVFGPVLLFALWGFWRAIRARTASPLTPLPSSSLIFYPSSFKLAWCLASGMLVHLVMHGIWLTWHADWSYGARYMTDQMPFWIVLMAFGIQGVWRRWLTRAVFVALLMYSVVVQFLGVEVDVKRWMLRNAGPDTKMADTAWQARDPQILSHLRQFLGLPDPPGAAR